ncbi:MAG: UDP-N-acetylglucosamine 1-carboxyvinyltransferase [Muribaculaceae bacterium]|nr:UDP-N-acetylglucosamine 1-carboxyvinyltransferase [Muribaculaceae bacterium]
MSSFVIEGGRTLSGEIVPQGAKNEALQVICATLLTSRPVTISNIPEIRDVRNLISLLELAGVQVTRHDKGCYTFRASDLNLDYLTSDDFVKRCAALRGSVMTVGPVLGRFGKAYFPKPGGDKIGRRKVDTHIQGFLNLGATYNYDPSKKAYLLTVPSTGLKGCYMLLDEASVTGTANILMAAACAEGSTTIYNAACEPYLQQLCSLMSKMGYEIEGIGSNLLTIKGCPGCHECSHGEIRHTILPDMIEVGSFIGMAAITRSAITVKNVSYNNLGIIPESFRRLGINLEQRGDDIFVPAQESYVI